MLNPEALKDEMDLMSLDLWNQYDKKAKKTMQEGYVVVSNMDEKDRTTIKHLIHKYSDKELFILDEATDIIGRRITGMFALCRKVDSPADVDSAFDLYLDSDEERLKKIKKRRNTKADLSDFWRDFNFALEK